MPNNLSLKTLAAAVAGSSAAIRVTTHLTPAGGDGDKIFPPTYEGGRYAIEQRRIKDQLTNCVLLDSVQSQANRMEQALKQRAADVKLPHFRVTIPRGDGSTIVTSLDAPHRVWDAIFRDSLWDGQPFRASPVGKRLVRSAPDEDATAFYEYAPTALLYGMWDSTSGEGGVGKVRWARAVVSEVIGLDAVRGRKTSSRIDPLGITADAATIYRSDKDGWTLDEKQAARDKAKKPLPFGKDAKAGKPSAINHGNITPSIGKKGDEENSGGVSISEGLQLTVLSLPQLRRLRFPAEGKGGAGPREHAGRTALAALALYAIAAAREDGYWFRSRCQLIPRDAHKWELVGETAQDVKPFTLTTEVARQLLDDAVADARNHGLVWTAPVELTPSPKLVELVRRSDDKVRTEGAADAGD